MKKLILYNYFRSSTSYRARIALYHKNLDFEYRTVHLLNNGGEQNAQAYKDLNAMAEVPTLVHNDKNIAQTMAIIEYLEDVFPQNPLFPKDPVLKAQVRQFCETINSFMHPLGNLKVLQYLGDHHQYTQAQKEEWFALWNHRGYAALEKTLEKTSGTFCFGDQVTAADAFLIPQIFASLRFNVDLKAYPLCQKINAHCKQISAFQKAHPLNQPDSPKTGS